MKQIIILMFFSIYLLNANFIELTIKNTNKKTSDFIFLESMNDSNSSNNNYEDLSKRKNNINLEISGNFNDMIGFNYDKTLSSDDFDSKEIYLGTSYMKYLSFKKITNDIKYSSRDTKKDITSYTLFNIIDMSKEYLKSSKIEQLSDAKNALLDINTSVNVHRDYTLEKFRLTSEYMYDIAKNDSLKNSEYFIPFIFSKQINSKFRVFGTAILSLVQYNYTDISNYIIDNNNSKRNISYKTKTQNDVLVLDDADDFTETDFHLVGKYRGYEYGYKITATYDMQDYSLFLTSYYKATSLKNKHKKDDKGLIESSRQNGGNVLVYESLKFKEQYINFGLNYRF